LVGPLLGGNFSCNDWVPPARQGRLPLYSAMVQGRPNAITCLFKEAHDASPPLNGKLSDDDLQAIQETLLPLLMVISYNQLNGVHSLTAILTKAVKYKANHGAKCVRPACLPLYDKTIADNATTVVRVHAEADHKSQLND
jgi:hypothetical protein